MNKKYKIQLSTLSEYTQTIKVKFNQSQTDQTMQQS